jgi:hypothetical protein
MHKPLIQATKSCFFKRSADALALRWANTQPMA